MSHPHETDGLCGRCQPQHPQDEDRHCTQDSKLQPTDSFHMKYNSITDVQFLERMGFLTPPQCAAKPPSAPLHPGQTPPSDHSFSLFNPHLPVSTSHIYANCNQPRFMSQCNVFAGWERSRKTSSEQGIIMLNLYRVLCFITYTLVFLVRTGSAQQVPDDTWQPDITTPEYSLGEGLRVAVDAAHGNFHTIEDSFGAFERLLNADGYVVSSFLDIIDPGMVRSCLFMHALLP